MSADYYFFAPTGGRYQTVFRGTLPRRYSIRRSQWGNGTVTLCLQLANTNVKCLCGRKLTNGLWQKYLSLIFIAWAPCSGYKQNFPKGENKNEKVQKAYSRSLHAAHQRSFDGNIHLRMVLHE